MRISGTGAWVVDVICDIKPNDITPLVEQYFAEKGATKGIVRGAATLKKEIEHQFGKNIEQILDDIAVPGTSVKMLGGVAAATLIGAAQMLEGSGIDVFFYTNIGDDENARIALELFRKTPLRLDKFNTKKAKCPSSIILNESVSGKKVQERSFLSESNAGEGLVLVPEDLDEDFFRSDIAFFASLFWEPNIKENLTRILRTCKERGCITVIETSSDPNLQGVNDRWELGDREEIYRYLDILLMDKAEALAYSGKSDAEQAFAYFKQVGVKSFLVTDGLKPTYFYSNGSIFQPAEGMIPVATPIIQDKAKGILPIGDTVGCGDNFAGGVIASLAMQLEAGEQPSIIESAILGNLCGAFASTYAGGTYYEEEPGEKKNKINVYRDPYRKDLSTTTQGRS
jgi:sugar/nucleoside kinase (ribokinase family)